MAVSTQSHRSRRRYLGWVAVGVALLSVVAMVAYVAFVSLAFDGLFALSDSGEPPLDRLEVTAEEATLSARVDGQGARTFAFVQYGLTKRYGRCSRLIAVPDGAEGYAVKLALNPLRARRLYHYRLAVEAQEGLIFDSSLDRTFTTPVGGRLVIDPSRSRATGPAFAAPMNCP